MIKAEDIVPVGRFAKTHGVKGEVNVDFDTDFDIDSCRCLIVDIDGIFVPFFIESYRFRNDITALVMLDGIGSEEKARDFFGKTAYVEREFVYDEDENSLKLYIGFSLVDGNGSDLGVITGIDDSTANVLFLLDNNRLIPVAAMDVIDIDAGLRRMKVNLPDGLLDLEF